jgi:hypothetical protein
MFIPGNTFNMTKHKLEQFWPELHDICGEGRYACINECEQYVILDCSYESVKDIKAGLDKGCSENCSYMHWAVDLYRHSRNSECEIERINDGKLEWQRTLVNDLTEADRAKRMRCKECWGTVAVSLGKKKRPPYFRHTEKYDGCPYSSNYDGSYDERHPQAVGIEEQDAVITSVSTDEPREATA